LSTKILAILAGIASFCFLVLVVLQVVEMRNYDAATSTASAPVAAAPAAAPEAAPAPAP
jgi:hypothetical protein